jgi:hypothetical protein
MIKFVVLTHADKKEFTCAFRLTIILYTCFVMSVLILRNTDPHNNNGE